MNGSTPKTTDIVTDNAADGDFLAERHRHELEHDSGLTPETIARRGYRTVTDPAELARLGFKSYAYKQAPGYLLPVVDTSGNNHRYYFKPDHPRPDSKNPAKVVKYESQPRDVGGVVLDVPLPCQQSIGDWRVPLLFTEGQKKADAAAQLGDYCVVDLIGTWCFGWKLWKTTGEPLDDWLPLLPSLQGRVCYICYDSDAADKSSVRQAEEGLTELLEHYGARVYIVRLPNEPDGRKNGIDDFLVRHGAEAFEQIVRTASPAHATDARELRRELSELAQMRRNPAIDSTEFRVRWALANETAHQLGKGRPEATFNRYAIADESGTSVQTAGKWIERITKAENCAFTMRTQFRPSDKDPDKSIKMYVLKPPGQCSSTAQALRLLTVPYGKPEHGRRTPRPYACPHGASVLAVEHREPMVYFDDGCLLPQSKATVVEDEPSKDASFTFSSEPPPEQEGGGPIDVLTVYQHSLLVGREGARPRVCDGCGEVRVSGKGELRDLGDYLLHDECRVPMAVSA